MATVLHPQYICGFVDGEGSFHVAIYKDSRMKTGLKFIPEFHVSQRVTSRRVLDQLVEAFGCGYVKANHANSRDDNTYVYVVRDRRDLLERIIPFFEKNQLQTTKEKDFRLFARIVQEMSLGKHRTPNGAGQILDLAYRMNNQGRYRRIYHHVS